MPDAIAIKLRAEPRAQPDQRADLAMFGNWVLCWLVLPNLAFLPVTMMGGPMRASEIALCGLFGLVARPLGYGLRLALFTGLLLYLLLTFIAGMFNMHISMILSVIGLVSEIRPAVSPEYAIGAALLILTFGVAAWRLRLRGDFKGVQWVIAAIALTLSLAAADYRHANETATAYHHLAPAGAPFSSATSQTGFAGLADGKRHLMIVVVESLGLPTNPALRSRLDAIWMRPAFADRFDISQGSTPFYNSTTKGEIRELCQRWGDFDEIDAPQPQCLPARLARRGYQTRAIHAFSPTFFSRDHWYPLVGFQTMRFGKDLEAMGASHCPNVFPGACDRDVPRLIGQQLAAAKQPQFIYWLTLNSHLPVVANRDLGTEDCAQLGTALDRDYPQACRLFAIWDDTAGALAAMTSRPDFPPTDILIVGDHMPPFTHQKSRLMFDRAHVPWILLRYRPSDPRPAR